MRLVATYTISSCHWLPTDCNHDPDYFCREMQRNWSQLVISSRGFLSMLSCEDQLTMFFWNFYLEIHIRIYVLKHRVVLNVKNSNGFTSAEHLI